MTANSLEDWIYEKVLGSGGFGQVELWKEKYTNKKIAIKRCMLPKTEIPPKQEMRWKKEIKIMNDFQHPNIVKAVQLPVKIKYNEPVLCMEYCNKGNLRKILNEPSNSCGLEQKEALSVMKDISSALMYLHQNNITHRDLKPENIVLHEVAENIIYKLIDLGLAKVLGCKTATASNVGTFKYAAPELFWANKYTCSVDYWSLGTVFFEVLTGYKPFTFYIQNLPKWMSCMNSKKYEEICARESNKEIKFYDHIVYPNDISEDIKNHLVEWFQIVLQMNPKKRGKHPHSNDTVIFTFLKEIFPITTINIFCISSYRMHQYHVYTDITFVTFQKWIEKKTDISVDKQILANSKGKVLNNDSKNLSLNDVPDYILYIYNSDNNCTIDDNLEEKELDSGWSISEIFELMLTDPDEIQDQITLRQCYTELIYIMRYEVNLFKHYVFAISTKFDIINSKLSVLNNNIEKNLPDLDLLFSEAERLIGSQMFSNITIVNSLFEKIENLRNNVFHKVKYEIASFQTQMYEFFNSDKLLNSLQEYTIMYEDFLSMFLQFEDKRLRQHSKKCCPEYVKDEINTLQNTWGDFDEKRRKLLADKDIDTTLKKLIRFEKNLPGVFNVVESGIKLVPSYKKQFHDALNPPIYEIQSNSNNQNHSLILNDDTEIGDSIVLLNVIEKLLEESFSKMICNLNNF